VYFSLYRRGLLGELYQTFLLGTGIKILASNYGDPSLASFGAEKCSFQLSDFIANISRLEQDIVDRKTALQTAITPVHAYQIW